MNDRLAINTLRTKAEGLRNAALSNDHYRASLQKKADEYSEQRDKYNAEAAALEEAVALLEGTADETVRVNVPKHAITEALGGLSE